MPVHSNGLDKPSAYFNRHWILYFKMEKCICIPSHDWENGAAFCSLCKSALTKSIHYNAIVYGILAKLMFIHCNNTDMTRSWVDQLPTKRLRELAARPQLSVHVEDDTIAIFTSLMSLNLAIDDVYPYSIGRIKANVTSTREQVNSFKFDRMYCGIN